jgi:hypothetical protein
MEMNYMLAYGSAEASLRLLWRFSLLEHLLPFQEPPGQLEWTYWKSSISMAFNFVLLTEWFYWTLQAAYFSSIGFKRRDKGSNMLLVSFDFAKYIVAMCEVTRHYVLPRWIEAYTCCILSLFYVLLCRTEPFPCFAMFFYGLLFWVTFDLLVPGISVNLSWYAIFN